MKTTFKQLLKISVSAGLLLLILFNIDLTQLVTNLSRFSPWTYGGLLGLMLVIQLINNLRWYLLLKVQGIECNFFTLYVLSLRGSAINLFLPSTVGGDIYKIYAVRQSAGKRTAAKISMATLLDRVLGLFALLFLAMVAAGTTTVLPHQTRLVIGAVCFLLLTGFVIALFIPRTLMRVFYRILPVAKKYNLFNQLFETMLRYTDSKQTVLVGWLLSLALQVLNVVNNFYIFLGLGLVIDFKALLLVMPLTQIASALPISVGGVGVQEVALSQLLRELSIQLTDITSFTFILYSLIGALGILSLVVPLSKRVQKFWPA